MNCIVIGVNHQTAPVEVRERFAIPEATVARGHQAPGDLCRD